MKGRSRPRALAPRKPSAVSIVIEDPRWREDASVLRLIRRAARLALNSATLCKVGVAAPRRGGRGSKSPPPAFTILLTDDARLRTFNPSLRRHDKPTHPFPFPT